MCATCGCEGDGKTMLFNLQTRQSGEIASVADTHAHEHVHADGTWHSHPRDHAHDHDHYPVRPSGEIDIQARVLAKNDALAAQNRAWFAGREILALNLVSAPGAGKTTLLERTIAAMVGDTPLFVIEGDQATSNDGERIRAAGAPAVQVNTGSGCHLDAEMVRRGLAELRPPPGAVVLIENVGNLVCPALFDLGEHAKVTIFSVTEGEDKPLKYPHMFRASELVLLNKIDLLPHLDFDVATARANVACVNPDSTIIEISALIGEGLPDWLQWIRARAAAAREFAAP
ncbi:MAG TPA: hydrogenase nickel incorporation protein HypB [Stellaceae bacterium]|nr:hydrogenase nickel incorporation protein HypB [Stellaceae bacterium]